MTVEDLRQKSAAAMRHLIALIGGQEEKIDELNDDIEELRDRLLTIELRMAEIEADR